LACWPASLLRREVAELATLVAGAGLVHECAQPLERNLHLCSRGREVMAKDRLRQSERGRTLGVAHVEDLAEDERNLHFRR
jgi:hypothetical protein